MPPSLLLQPVSLPQCFFLPETNYSLLLTPTVVQSAFSSTYPITAWSSAWPWAVGKNVSLADQVLSPPIPLDVASSMLWVDTIEGPYSFLIDIPEFTSIRVRICDTVDLDYELVSFEADLQTVLKATQNVTASSFTLQYYYDTGVTGVQRQYSINSGSFTSQRSGQFSDPILLPLGITEILLQGGDTTVVFRLTRVAITNDTTGSTALNCPSIILPSPPVCVDGTYLVNATQMCLGCPIGAACVGGSTNKCMPGSYQLLANQSVCLLCPMGSYCVGGAAVTPCSDDADVTTTTGLSAASQCVTPVVVAPSLPVGNPFTYTPTQVAQALATLLAPDAVSVNIFPPSTSDNVVTAAGIVITVSADTNPCDIANPCLNGEYTC